MTDADLAAIRARCAAATIAPWTHECFPKGTLSEHFEVHDVSWGDPADGSERYSLVADLSPGDAEFIAHARADVPELLAEVERLQGEVDAWQSEYRAQQRRVESL